MKVTRLPSLLRALLWPVLALALIQAALAATTADQGVMAQAAAAVDTPPLKSTAQMTQETISLVYCLEKTHYLQKQFVDMDQREFLRAYMSDLDPLHLFFLGSDVKSFQDEYAPTLAYNVGELGNLSAAFDIFQKSRERTENRVAWINKRLDGNFDLTSKETFQPDRTDLPWPATKEDSDMLWEQQLQFEMINELLAQETRDITAANKKVKDAAAGPVKTADAGAKAPTAAPADQTATPAPAKVAAVTKPKTEAEKIAAAKDEIRKRYNSYLRSLEETEADEVQETFLNTLTMQYDPHSSFFSEHQLEDFDIQMRNSLVGIGAILTNDDGYCVIHELLPGGPAEKSGLLHPGDKIIGVGQADGDIVDVVGAKLRKTVNMIRGTADTNVRLLVVSANDPGAKKTVTLTRKEIKVTSNLAKADIIEVPEGDDHTVPIGVIDLPAFYGKAGNGDDFSTTEDVRELIGKLKAAGVQGLILDVRRNGGGFLNEAIDLTGLFIPSDSPVLQVRNTMAKLDELADQNSKIVWDGPLLVLVSKESASATEILTGALQDYRRALVVGDHNTHGKGTVQQVFQFDKFDPAEKGAAKITVQKWYLPDGNSIQSKGIAADIVLPSTIDYLPIGEVDEKHALVWDSVKPLPLSLTGDGPWRAALLDDKMVSDLRDLSLSRQQSLDEFVFLKDRIAWEKAREEQKQYSLDYQTRLDQRKDDITFRDQLKARVEALAKNNYKSTDILLEAAKAQDKDAVTKEPPAPEATDTDDADEDSDPPVIFDIQLRESLRVMADWIRLENQRQKGDSTTKLAANKEMTTAMAPVSTSGTATAGPAAQAVPDSATQPAEATR